MRSQFLSARYGIPLGQFFKVMLVGSFVWNAYDESDEARHARAANPAGPDLGSGIGEIRVLVEKDSTASITDRWRALARRKLPEMTSLIDRATRMKKMLEDGLHCGCARIEDCVLHGCAPAPLIQLRPSRPRL